MDRYLRSSDDVCQIRLWAGSRLSISGVQELPAVLRGRKDGGMKPEWQPIKTYPTEHDLGPDTYWGPEVTVLIPERKAYTYGSTVYTAHLEADEWLVRDAEKPWCWSTLEIAPTHWSPLPELLK